MFTKVQIYCEEQECCFNDIEKSERPSIVINTDHIISLSHKTNWGLCAGHERYPFRILHMTDGNRYLCVLESADELEKLLFQSER